MEFHSQDKTENPLSTMKHRHGRKDMTLTCTQHMTHTQQMTQY